MPVVPLTSSTSYNDGASNTKILALDSMSSTEEDRYVEILHTGILKDGSVEERKDKAPKWKPISSRERHIHKEKQEQQAPHQRRTKGKRGDGVFRMKDPPSTVHFQDSTTIVHSYDPRRVSTAPSLFSELTELRRSLTLSENDNSIPESAPSTSRGEMSVATGTLQFVVQSQSSRAFSMLSEQSSEFSCMNRELMDDAYSKYESFTPFKTPLQSKHLMTSDRIFNTRDGQQSHQPQSPRKRATAAARDENRVIASMHNLDASEFLPITSRGGQICGISKSSSFIGAGSLVHLRHLKNQSKNGADHYTPSEMRISKVQLLPAREKSPFTMVKIKADHRNHPMQQKKHSNHLHTEEGRSYFTIHHQQDKQEHHQQQQCLLVNKHLLCHSTESTLQHVPPPSPALSKASNSSGLLSSTSSNESVDSLLPRRCDSIQINDGQTATGRHQEV